MEINYGLFKDMQIRELDNGSISVSINNIEDSKIIEIPRNTFVRLMEYAFFNNHLETIKCKVMPDGINN